jgi:hypothetical protein
MRNPTFRILSTAVVMLAMAGGLSAAARPFGSACQQDFQNGYLPTLSSVWDTCSGFNNQFDNTDSQSWYYNLSGGKWWWESSGDEYGLDTVNLVFADTHGGAWGGSSVWAMFDQYSYASSSSMRLGDESSQLMVLSTYACETMKYDDGQFWTRMGPIFSGGLYMATGSHASVYSGWTTDDVGADYASDLQNGWLIKDAWRDGASDWYVDNDLTVMTTGANSTDCSNRLNGMTWTSVAWYPRLRDWQIGWYCGAAWHT